MIGLFNKLRGRKTAAIPDDLWNVTVISLPFLEVLGYDERVQLKALAEFFLASRGIRARPAALN